MDLTQAEIQAVHDALHTHITTIQVVTHTITREQAALQIGPSLAAMNQETAAVLKDLHEKFEKADDRTQGEVHKSVFEDRRSSGTFFAPPHQA